MLAAGYSEGCGGFEGDDPTGVEGREDFCESALD
jgi:hypothetical protein